MIVVIYYQRFIYTISRSDSEIVVLILVNRHAASLSILFFGLPVRGLLFQVDFSAET
jgi:hypothetical protein